MNWKDSFKENTEVVLSTSSKDNIPNANIVISLGIIDGKLLVANCQMNNTINNLRYNPNICVIGGHFRIKGKVEIFSSGKYFDICASKDGEYHAKDALLISIDEVFSLDDVCKL